MEIIEAIGWVSLGFVPTLFVLETYWRVRLNLRIARSNSSVKKQVMYLSSRSTDGVRAGIHDIPSPSRDPRTPK
jgi:hypothetical protein